MCAVIVTFRPKPDVLENLAKVRPQVQDLVVVDNGSSAEAIEPLRQAAERLKFKLIENGKNLGIAAALNIGVLHAKSQGRNWVALFDQDSAVAAGFIHAMLARFETHPQKSRIAILMPRYVDPNTGIWQAPKFTRDGNPLIALTSGSVMPMRTFDICGLFEEDLVMDCVDSEYCLRAGRLGYIVILCEQAILLHAVGNPQAHSLLNARTITVTHHSTARRYYITRNHLVVIGRNWRSYPHWCFGMLDELLRQTVKILLVEDERWPKLASIAHGIFDALRGHMGWVVEL